jgi:hypothetical protein
MKSLTVRSFTQALVGIVGCVSTLLMLSPATQVHGATLTVTTLSDVVDANDGVLSLREAVTAAASNDVIDFSSSLFTSGPQVLTMTTFLSKGGALEIRGPGKDLLTIRGPRSDRTMVGYEITSGVLTVTLSSAPEFTASAGGLQGRVLIHSGTSAINGEHAVTGVSGNTFTAATSSADIAFTTVSGQVSSPIVSSSVHWGLAGRFFATTGTLRVNNLTVEGFMAERGGAFQVSGGGSLILDNVRIRRNAAFDWYNCGGAIKADRGNIDIRNSIFVENLGKCDGAINMGDGNGTTMYIADTTFTNNISNNGWAVRSYLPAQLVNVSISGTKNYAGQSVGAFSMNGYAMPVSISGSTFSGGGAVSIENHSSTIITNSTFTTSSSTSALVLNSTFAALTGNTVDSCSVTASVGIVSSSNNTFTSVSNCENVTSTTGVKAVSYSRSANIVTLNTLTAHGFTTGDVVRLCGIQALNSPSWCGPTPTILSTPTTTSLTISYTGSDVGTAVITSEAARGAYIFDQVASLPGIPTITNVMATSGQAVVTWTAPSSGTSSITDYVIQLSENSGAWTTFNDGTRTTTNATVTGLTNGSSYRFRVAAVSSVGTGTYSSASSAVTPGSVSTTTTTTTLAPSTTAPVSTTPSTSTTTVAPVSNVPTSQTGNTASTVPSTNISGSGTASIVTTSTVVALVTTTTTSPVTTTTATTTTTIPAPEAPAAEPGEAGALVDGEIQEAVVTRLNNALNVEVGGVTASIWGLTSEGVRVDLDETGNLRLENQDSVVVEAVGFEPGQEIEVWMFSTPSQLGVLTAGADGKISGTFPLPNSVTAGDHRIVLEGRNSLGQDVTVGVGLYVGELAGDGVSPWVIWLPVTLAVSLGLIIPTTLRRRRRQSADS